MVNCRQRGIAHELLFMVSSTYFSLVMLFFVVCFYLSGARNEVKCSTRVYID